MTVSILAFGIAKDIIGASSICLDISNTSDVAALKTILVKQYPKFEQLASLAIAVNAEYQSDDFLLNANDEIVIIPPVSGG